MYFPFWDSAVPCRKPAWKKGERQYRTRELPEHKFLIRKRRFRHTLHINSVSQIHYTKQNNKNHHKGNTSAGCVPQILLWERNVQNWLLSTCCNSTCPVHIQIPTLLRKSSQHQPWKVMGPLSLEVLRNHGSAAVRGTVSTHSGSELIVGTGDLDGLFQPWCFYNSI